MIEQNARRREGHIGIDLDPATPEYLPQRPHLTET